MIGTFRGNLHGGIGGVNNQSLAVLACMGPAVDHNPTGGRLWAAILCGGIDENYPS